MELEDEADGRGAVLGGVVERLEPLAADRDRARVGPVERADRFRSVLLPPPEGPVSETTSPGSSRKETSSSAQIRPSSNDFETWSTTTSTPPGGVVTTGRHGVSEHLPPLGGHDHRRNLSVMPTAALFGKVIESQKLPKKR